MFADSVQPPRPERYTPEEMGDLERIRYVLEQNSGVRAGALAAVGSWECRARRDACLRMYGFAMARSETMRETDFERYKAPFAVFDDLYARGLKPQGNLIAARARTHLKD